MNWSDLAYEQAKCTMYFKQYLMCVYLFVNITRFDLYSVILFCCFYVGNRGKPTGRIHFSRLRSASLADLCMRICYQNNGGSNISKRENSKFIGIIFAIVHLFRLGSNRFWQSKFLSIDSCENYVVPRGVQQNTFSKHLLGAHPTAYNDSFSQRQTL
jgi:hypothetical protein